VTVAYKPLAIVVKLLTFIPEIGVDTTMSVICEIDATHVFSTYKSKEIGTLICASKQSVIDSKTGNDGHAGVGRTCIKN
jgi:hypothetical protein